jgi:hypothetical protein
MKGHRLPGRSVLGVYLSIPGHDFPSRDFQEVGASLLMKKMQRQRFHARRYIEARE